MDILLDRSGDLFVGGNGDITLTVPLPDLSPNAH